MLWWAISADLELRPLSCQGMSADADPTNIGRNDVLGGYSVTLIDGLDMFAVSGIACVLHIDGTADQR
jgi:hypothetical protein